MVALSCDEIDVMREIQLSLEFQYEYQPRSNLPPCMSRSSNFLDYVIEAVESFHKSA